MPHNFVRRSHKHGNLYPEVYNWLRHIPNTCLFHVDYKDRHPFSRYSNSLQKIMESYIKVLDEIENVNAALLNPDGQIVYNWNKLSKAQEELLFSLLSHFDDCYHILKSIHPPILSGTEVFADKWLKQVAHPTFSDFKSETSIYRDPFSEIINKIKHNGDKLCSLVITSINKPLSITGKNINIIYLHENVRIPGYYLEGMQADGVLGPHPDIHPGNTAISFNYDLRYHFANIYRVSKSLKKAVSNGIKRLHGVTLTYPRKLEKPPRKGQWEQVAERISHLSMLFYENEYRKNIPEINFLKTSKGSEVQIATPRKRSTPWEGDTIIQSQFQVDAVALSYRPPYGVR